MYVAIFGHWTVSIDQVEFLVNVMSFMYMCVVCYSILMCAVTSQLSSVIMLITLAYN